jgi:hypothetical protein
MILHLITYKYNINLKVRHTIINNRKQNIHTEKYAIDQPKYTTEHCKYKLSQPDICIYKK